MMDGNRLQKDKTARGGGLWKSRTEGPYLGTAVGDISLSQVSWPTTPSTFKALRFWKILTAVKVA